MHRLTPLLFLCCLAATPATTTIDLPERPPERSPTVEMRRGLAWALELGPEEARELDRRDLIEAAEWLNNWPNMGTQATVTGDTESYIGALRKSSRILGIVQDRWPDEAMGYWMHARNNYDIGELLPEDAVERRLSLYEEMIELTRTCRKQTEPDDGSCLHFLATGLGRLSTTKGLLNTLFVAEEVEGLWLEALDRAPDYVAPAGTPMVNNIRYGLGVFYRMVPEWWIAKVIIGTRGDIVKSVEMFRAAAAAEPYRLELRKELAASLLCYALREEEPDERAEAEALLEAILAGRFDRYDVRATDRIDKVHARDLLEQPDRACGYSRDGYEEIRKEDVSKGG